MLNVFILRPLSMYSNINRDITSAVNRLAITPKLRVTAKDPETEDTTEVDTGEETLGGSDE